MKILKPLLPLAALLFSACGGGQGPASTAGTSPITPAPPTAPAPAPDQGTRDPLGDSRLLHSMSATRAIDCPRPLRQAINHPALTCFSSQVPEDYRQPAGRKIELLTLVMRSRAAEPRGTVYLLDQLGRHGAGLLSNPAADAAALHDDLLGRGWDVVVPAHRGTASSALDCPQADYAHVHLMDIVWRGGLASHHPDLQTQADACLGELIQRLGGDAAAASTASQYDTVNAARDLVSTHASIARTGTVALVGEGYGAYWAQRVAQLHPRVVSKMVLARPMNLLGRVEEIHTYRNALLEDVLAECQAHPGCSAQLGRDETPRTLTQRAIGNIASGRCGAAVDRAADTSVASRWEASGYGQKLLEHLQQLASRPLVPYMIRIAADCRVDRVQEALRNKTIHAAVMPPMVAAAERGDNRALHETMLYAEWLDARDPATPARLDHEIQATRDTAFPNNEALRIQRTLGTAQAMTFNGVPRGFKTVQAQALVLNARVDPDFPSQLAAQTLQAMRAAGLAPEHYDSPQDAQTVLHTGCGRQRVLHFLGGQPAEHFDCALPEVDWTFAGVGAQMRAQTHFLRNNPWHARGLPP